MVGDEGVFRIQQIHMLRHEGKGILLLREMDQTECEATDGLRRRTSRHQPFEPGGCLLRLLALQEIPSHEREVLGGPLRFGNPPHRGPDFVSRTRCTRDARGIIPDLPTHQVELQGFHAECEVGIGREDLHGFAKVRGRNVVDRFLQGREHQLI